MIISFISINKNLLLTIPKKTFKFSPDIIITYGTITIVKKYLFGQIKQVTGQFYCSILNKYTLLEVIIIICFNQNIQDIEKCKKITVSKQFLEYLCDNTVNNF